MFPARWWRSTPTRMAIIFAAFFLTIFAIAMVTTYFEIEHEISKRIDSRVSVEFRDMEAAFRAGGMATLTEIVTTESANSAKSGEIYSLVLNDGSASVGSSNLPELRSGFQTEQLSRPGNAEGVSYRLFTGPVGTAILTVGLSREDVDEVEDILLYTFLIASAFIIALTLLGSGYLARLANERLDAMRAIMDEVSDGKWNQRLPISARGDDVDTFSGFVNEMLDQLQALMTAMRQISADIAHDLKTPLSGLYIGIDKAIQKLDAGDLSEADLQIIQADASSINSTFDALLSIAQIEGGSRRARFTPVDLNDLLVDLAEIYTHIVEEAGQTLIFIPPSTPVKSINGDRDLIRQLVSNLLANAIHHCPAGTAITLNLETATTGRPSISVADTGPGIPVDERENVLRRLYRLEKSRTTPGSGLGLSMVNAIANLHEAVISLSDNEPGLRVTIQFPAHPIQGED